jgi:Asp-tRNA(Asn)/Glu-tRNA(Gln) amidotransferase C subunit
MGKIMPLELLSSIKGAKPSDAVSELFKVIKKASTENEEESLGKQFVNSVGVTMDSLRCDTVKNCPDQEKELIKKNFPKEKNGYLVVPKVIED